MLDPVHLRDHIIKPVLVYLEPEIPYSRSAEHLLIGTAVQESRLTYLHQGGNGPAVGLWQMEPATHDDIWHNYIAYQPGTLESKIVDIKTNIEPFLSSSDQMAGNLYYACAMARLLYRRVKAPLPQPGDPYAMGSYWKQYYNTPQGKGTVAQFVSNWNKVAEVFV